MGYHKESSYQHTRYQSTHGEDTFSIRHALADWILHVQLPDLQTFLVSLLVLYITWKVTKWSLGLVFWMARPLLLIALIIILLPILFEFKSCLNLDQICSCAIKGVKTSLSKMESIGGVMVQKLSLFTKDIFTSNK